ncbi:MAG: hypothetical protein HY235_14615 [Acidobacteria bacterium]|nr:hypothetical protein [Acidobacteriota bacterium]
MGLTLDLGRRVELVSMDPHCGNITIALYRLDTAEGPAYVVHTYSRLPEAPARIRFIREAMRVLGGMEFQEIGERVACPRFLCGGAHQAAARRAFLEACKLPPDARPEPRPLSVLDRKSGETITVVSGGGGVYRVHGREAVAAGLSKLGEMEENAPAQISFACGHPHDALIGLLLPRALNVRAAVREQELTAARGVLVAPSAQQ